MNTREVVIQLLSQLGSNREVREYLRKFSDSGAPQFAVLKVGGEVIQHELSELASAIGFLHHVGLLPVVLHGGGVQLNQALEEAGIETDKLNGFRVTTPEVMSVARPVIYGLNERLANALEERGIRTRTFQHGVFECEYEDQERLGLVGRICSVNIEGIVSTIQAGALPVVSCLGETPAGQVMNINADVAASRLVLEIQPQKIIFITPSGGLLDEQNRIISAISLETDYRQLAEAQWVHSGMRLKLEQIAELLGQLPPETSVSITSARNLTRELFTHRGAGTLIRKGESFQVDTQLTSRRKRELADLVETCFERQLLTDWSDFTKLDALIWASSGRAAALIETGTQGIPYMDKFVVTPAAQGEGVGTALWQQVRTRYPRLYWRSRSNNPINSWYNRQADFCIRRGPWQVFGYGLDQLDRLSNLVEEAGNRPDCWLTDSAGQSGPSENEGSVV